MRMICLSKIWPDFQDLCTLPAQKQYCLKHSQIRAVPCQSLSRYWLWKKEETFRTRCYPSWAENLWNAPSEMPGGWMNAITWRLVCSNLLGTWPQRHASWPQSFVCPIRRVALSHMPGWPGVAVLQTHWQCVPSSVYHTMQNLQNSQKIQTTPVLSY